MHQPAEGADGGNHQRHRVGVDQGKGLFVEAGQPGHHKLAGAGVQAGLQDESLCAVVVALNVENPHPLGEGVLRIAYCVGTGHHLIIPSFFYCFDNHHLGQKGGNIPGVLVHIRAVGPSGGQGQFP